MASSLLILQRGIVRAEAEAVATPTTVVRAAAVGVVQAAATIDYVQWYGSRHSNILKEKSV